MLKIIFPIIVFIFLIYAISYYWESANPKNKKKIASSVAIVLFVSLFLTMYLIID